MTSSTRQRTPDGRLRVLLLDVTGHGLAAAMTVTRLSGEIERIIAEQPDIGPAALLQCLNHYTELLLSQHSIFATAVVAEVDPMPTACSATRTRDTPPRF